MGVRRGRARQRRIARPASGLCPARPRPCWFLDFPPETRLIKNLDARPAARLEKPDRRGIPNIETVKSAAREQLQLIEQNIAARAKLARKTVVAAKLPGDGIAAAIGKFGKGYRDEDEAGKIWRNSS